MQAQAKVDAVVLGVGVRERLDFFQAVAPVDLSKTEATDTILKIAVGMGGHNSVIALSPPKS